MKKHHLTLAFSLLLCWVYLSRSTGLEYDTTVRPFVYRQLVPILTWGVQKLFQVNFDTGASIVLFGFTIGMVEALRSWWQTFGGKEEQTEAYTLLTLLVVFLLASWTPHIYDIPTVFLFTVSLLFIYKKKLLAFFLLFPIICLNRETSFLLIVIFVWWCWRDLTVWKLFWLTGLLFAIFLTVKELMWILYSSYPGYDAELHAVDNLQAYTGHPSILIPTILMGLLLLGILRLQWKKTPEYLAWICLLFLPILTVLYLLVGYSFELRVFLEVIPTLTWIGFYDQ